MSEDCHEIRAMKIDTTEEAEEIYLREIGIIPPFFKSTPAPVESPKELLEDTDENPTT